jgi:3-oxoacyl-[acyl-carrier protein] reductase
MDMSWAAISFDILWRMNMREFDGQVVLVTGAGSGIGQSHAEHFAQLGATVIVHDKDREKVESTIQSVQANGGRAVPLVSDVSDAALFSSEIRRVGDMLGGIHVLVNNVGIPADKPIEEIGQHDFEIAFRINVFSSLAATQAVLPTMKQRRSGKIVNTSSNWGLIGQENSSLYSATKAALLGFTKSWARELAPWNINVNCVAPGGIKTALLKTSEARLERIPLKRHGEPIEVSYLVAFLASENAGYMTGEVLGLSGGELIVGC